jgi:hypothetical protein
VNNSAPPSATVLRGRSLLLARAARVVIAVLALGLFVASIASYVFNVLNPGQAGWMRAVEAPAGVVSALDILGVLASITAALLCLTLAAVLFLRKSEDWMVVFVSSYLLVYGVVLAGPLESAEDFYPGWPSSAADVVQPLFLTTPTIALFVLFPDGRLVTSWTRWLILFSIPLTVAVLYSPPYGWALIGMVVLGAMFAQIYRYRRLSTPTDGQQTKWVLFGILLWVLLMGNALRTLWYRVEPPPWQPSSLVDRCQFNWLVAHNDHRAALVEHRYPSLPPL